jgi:hypothetical protein
VCVDCLGVSERSSLCPSQVETAVGVMAFDERIYAIDAITTGDWGEP